MIVGVMKTSSLRFWAFLDSLRNSLPTTGRSPSTGTLSFVVTTRSVTRPPSTSVWPSHTLACEVIWAVRTIGAGRTDLFLLSVDVNGHKVGSIIIISEEFAHCRGYRHFGRCSHLPTLWGSYQAPLQTPLAPHQTLVITQVQIWRKCWLKIVENKTGLTESTLIALLRA